MRLIDYSKSTRTNGIQMLAVVLLTSCMMFVFLNIFFPDLWSEDPVFFFIFHAITVVLGIIGGWAAISDIRTNGVFYCWPTSEKLECYSPNRLAGESFSLHVASISKIEHKVSDDSYSWYLWDNNGRRFQLTYNYGNPCQDIIDELKRLRPDLAEVET